MTNETDLRECSAQIDLVRQLIDQPETFDLDKILPELETKKKLLMTFKPRDYATILKGLESGVLIHPGDWIKMEAPKPEELSRVKEEQVAKADILRLKKLEEAEKKAKIAELKENIKELEI